jgi:hypothetical protein
MLNSDETKAGGKPKDRKGKPPQASKKERRAKAAAQVPETDQPQNVAEEIGEPVALAETVAPAAANESAAPLPALADTSPIAPSAPESTPASYRTLADAWGSYSRTSLDQTRSYFEKLAGVRSLGAAFEVQAEFAKQACETFVAQSQRISELQGELAKQRFKRLEGLWRR